MTDVKVYRNGARTGGVQRFRSLTPVTHQAYPQVRGKCAAVLAAAGRAVLLLAVLASLLWTGFGPQGAWPLAWLLLAAAVVSCAVPAWIALQPEGGGDRAS